MHPQIVLTALLVWTGFRLAADGPADNRFDNVRPVPPPGIPISTAIHEEMTAGAQRLGNELLSLRQALSNQPSLLALLPDVQIFHKSVDWAFRYHEVFRTNEFDAARIQLNEGFLRVAALRSGKSPWTTQRGLVVGGYRSRIDGSIQPFGLVVPDSWEPGSGRRHRLDFWFHGRGEQLSELAFLSDRMRNRGEFTPADTFVLHLYGRYCNGSRFAGETDFWEAFDEVRRRYPIDENRLVVRGFSLGGASCWHIATHFASRWAAAAPGAGFSETADFLKVFQKETLLPTPWEQKLWRMYDSTEHALNVSMVPMVAYSGADDTQIQAARAMERALANEGMLLTHLIAPKTGHRYEPATKAELNRRIDALAAHGRNPFPRDLHFVTHTLRYNEMAWVTVDALAQHWEPARVEGYCDPDASAVELRTTNVTAITLRFPPGTERLDPRRPVSVELDGEEISAGKPGSDRSWSASFHRQGASWQLGRASQISLVKKHGLQGPIDDAFMDSFMMIRPTGVALNPTVGAWTTNEFQHAAQHWRSHYRGDPVIKDDVAVSDEDIAGSNLVLFGDPQSNRLLRRLLERLPIRWDESELIVNGRNYPATSHAPVLIFPNPLNPERYIVLNSGFTFREYDYLNNARQTSKLPDWCVVDTTKPVTSRGPSVVAGGFFGEHWEWQ